jgi:hypothetical protein
MTEPMFEIQEKFCIHYWLDGNSHSMDAVLQNKCEHEYLGLVQQIAKDLNLEIIIETSPFENGGLIRWFSILRKNENKNAPVSTAFLAAILAAIFVSPIGKTGEKIVEKLFEDRELSDMQKNKIRLELQKLKDDSATNFQNTIIKKKKSNFYENLNKEKSVTQVSYYAADSSNQRVGSERFVKKSEFKDFLLITDEIEPQIDDAAQIEIIAPVLKKGKYKWLGLYEGKSISFNMKSIEFRQSIQNGEIEFKNGSLITCRLQINKKIDNDGEEIISGYDVLSVDAYTEDGIQKETNEGIAKKRRNSEKKMQLSLFDQNSSSQKDE